jgi:hypothetical protein
MGKKALGKGLKDLLPQQKGVDDKKSPKNMKMQKKRVELQKVVDEYREKGFTVTKLSKSLKRDIKAMEAAEKEFKEGLKKLEEVQEILNGLDLTGFDEEAKKIEERIKDPFRANDLLEVVSVLEKTIIEMKDEELKTKEDKMDTWIQGQKKVMIDLMGIYKERAEDGSVPEEAGEEGAAGEAPMDGEQAELRTKLEEWKGKGYLVTRLESILMDDINQAKEEFTAFEENIDKINRLNERLENLDTEGYEAKVRLIKTKLNYPNLANEVEKEIIKLETKILGAPVEEPEAKEEPPETEEAAPEEEEEVPETGEGEVDPEAAEGEIPEEAAEGEVAPEAAEGEIPEEAAEGEEAPEAGEDEGLFNPEEVMQEQEGEGEEQPQEEVPGEEQPQEDIPGEEQPQEDIPGEEQPQEDIPEGEQPQEDIPEGEQPQEDIPGEEQPQEETPEGEQPQEDIPDHEEADASSSPEEQVPQEGEQAQEETPGEEQPQEETPGEEQPQEEGTGGDLFDPEAILREMEGGEGEEQPPGEEQPQEETPEETPQEEGAEEPEKPAGPSEYGDNPEDLPQLLEEAQNAYRDRDFQKAVEYFDRVLALDPDNSNAIFMRKRAASKL